MGLSEEEEKILQIINVEYENSGEKPLYMPHLKKIIRDRLGKDIGVYGIIENLCLLGKVIYVSYGRKTHIKPTE